MNCTYCSEENNARGLSTESENRVGLVEKFSVLVFSCDKISETNQYLVYFGL